jgi:hypothetical protein
MVHSEETCCFALSLSLPLERAVIPSPSRFLSVVETSFAISVSLFMDNECLSLRELLWSSSSRDDVLAEVIRM